MHTVVRLYYHQNLLFIYTQGPEGENGVSWKRTFLESSSWIALESFSPLGLGVATGRMVLI